MFGDMMQFRLDLKSVVAAFAFCAAPAVAQDDGLDDLFAALRQAEQPEARQIVDKIGAEWSRTGSDSIDLLLSRGQRALGDEDFDGAIGHFTAAIDAAPDVAESYNGRATAYFNKKMFGPALEDIRQAIALNPRHFGAMTGLAIILDDIGASEAALAAWEEVTRLYPASPQAEQAMPRLKQEVGGREL